MPALSAGIIPVTPFVQNCTLLMCTQTRKAALVDPGGDKERILAVVADQGVTVEKIFLTHGHLDHAGAAADLRDALHVPIEGPHEDDRFWLEGIAAAGARYGIPDGRNVIPDRWLVDGDEVTFGAITLGVRHCPGHTPGHLVFFHAPSRLALVGDVLFAGSIGRTDLPRGDFRTLIASIQTKLWPLGDDMVFISGHGQTSTFGRERKTNPFVSDIALEQTSIV